MYVYATRQDKNGANLTTSYNNKASAQKYGGAGATIWSGVRSIDLATMATSSDENSGNPIIRSKIVSNVVASNVGKFGIFAVIDGVLVDTKLRFGSYGAANTTMKALVAVYSTMYVLELNESGQSQTEAQNETDEPVF